MPAAAAAADGTAPDAASPALSESGDEREEPPRERAYIDEHGFLINPQQAQPPAPRAREKARVAQLTDQWLRMLCRWPQTVGDYPKLRRRVRRGVPHPLRGLVWQLLLGSRAAALQYPGLFEDLLKREMDPELLQIARRDLGRTFPNHALFLGAEGVGQQQLLRVLRAFAVYDPRVGYCQGMGFIAATLLTQMGEEDAFFAFLVLMKSERFDLAALYLPGFPRVQRSFRQLRILLHRFCPRLAKHFGEEGIDVSYFASQWFMTLFVYQFPFRLLLPVWDVFLVDSWKAMMRISLALLILEEERLLGMKMEGILPYLKVLHEDKDPVILIAEAYKLKLTNRMLDEIERDEK